MRHVLDEEVVREAVLAEFFGHEVIHIRNT